MPAHPAATAPDWRPVRWPMPGDAAAAARLRDEFARLGRAEAACVRRHPGLFDAIGGHSPYLTGLALREAATLRRILMAGPAGGPGAVVRQALARIAAAPPATPRPRLAALLREAKRQAALAIALADIARLWTLHEVTAALSDLAETSLQAAVRHLLHAAAGAGRLHLPDRRDPVRGSGFSVLGMGKLGARELNYSSDIDLVLLYDPAAQPGREDALGGCFTRIARGLVALMQERDSDGYVFRTDLRLRPDPAATPPAIALPAALAYYESMGQNWERAAMLKARPVAGDLRVGAGFLDAIRPFIWRKHLDFAAVADIHAMKRRIDAHKTKPDVQGQDDVARIAGRNLKLGRGGIREIEFLAQTLELVWGGHEPWLREPKTLDALRKLSRAGHLPRRAVAELTAAYRFLRTAEHRLQMVADRQTHSLPETPAQIDEFARFLGFAGAAPFAAVLLGHCARVQARYGALFEAGAEAPEPGGALDFRGATEQPAALATLADMGFANPGAVVATVRGWYAGRLRALRSLRAQELMALVLPRLFAALARQAQPDIVFGRFDAFLGSLPAGIQLLSLFHRNPALIDRIVAVLGAAPSLADHLARVPSALEGLLSQEVPVPPARLLRERLRDARALDEALVTIGRAAREEDFRIAVATMEGRLDADAAGLARTAMAEAALAAMLPRVLADHIARYGRVRGGAMVVVALGKAGGREMMAGSDLDLMLIYDHPADIIESTARAGGRALPASQWYIRAAHAVVAALTASGPSGPLYAVDMRLRPSGRKGPVAVSLAAFCSYHRETKQGGAAWTWERMALTRARVVAGPRALAGTVTAAIADGLRHAGPAARINHDAAAMRARLIRDLPPTGPWDVKHRAGGQMEVEAIVQTLILRHVRRHPEIASPTTRVALHRLHAAGLLDADATAVLVRADHVWRTVQGLLRITIGPAIPAELPEPALRALLPAVSAVDAADLRATLDILARQVRALFTRLVGAPVPTLLEEART